LIGNLTRILPFSNSELTNGDRCSAGGSTYVLNTPEKSNSCPDPEFY
jgi:hypothetical protein